MADALVRDHGLNEEGKQSEGKDLREGADVQLLEVLEELVMVVTGDGLHEDAYQHRGGEQDQFDDDNSGEAGKPIGGFAHGERVVDTLETGVALAPEQLGGIERGHDKKEKSGAPLYGLEHQVGYGAGVGGGGGGGEGGGFW